MNLQTIFKRVITVGPTTWGQDTLPQDANGNFLAPGNTLGTLNNGTVDNVVTVNGADFNGQVTRRMAVAMSSTATTPIYFGADLYVYDRGTNQYFKTHDSMKTLRVGRINYFDIANLLPTPPTQANVSGTSTASPLVSAASKQTMDFVLITYAPPSAALIAGNVGTYTFAMAGALSTIGTETPNPDDEANAVFAVTPNDGAGNLSLPFGACRWLFSTDATLTHTVKLTTIDDFDATAPTVTLATFNGKIPIRARKVFATGTTATPLFAVY
jgi:hypothetical protein